MMIYNDLSLSVFCLFPFLFLFLFLILSEPDPEKVLAPDAGENAAPATESARDTARARSSSAKVLRCHATCREMRARPNGTRSESVPSAAPVLRRGEWVSFQPAGETKTAEGCSCSRIVYSHHTATHVFLHALIPCLSLLCAEPSSMSMTRTFLLNVLW